MTLPFCRNSTRATEPSASLAFADSGMLAGATKFVPAVGEVSATIGGTFVPFTVIESVVVDTTPAASVARAVMTCEPAPTFDHLY